MIRAIKHLTKLNRFAFNTLGIFFLLVASACFGLLSPEGSNRNPLVESLREEGILVLIVSAIILGPIIETLIFQAFPHWIIYFVLRTKKRHCIYLIISSVLFGMFHFYSLPYFVFGTIVGFLLSFLYYAGTFRKDGAILPTAFIHGMHNLFVFLLELWIP